jgi:hypothetical protein
MQRRIHVFRQAQDDQALSPPAASDPAGHTVARLSAPWQPNASANCRLIMMLFDFYGSTNVTLRDVRQE